MCEGPFLHDFLFMFSQNAVRMAAVCSRVALPCGLSRAVPLPSSVPEISPSATASASASRAQSDTLPLSGKRLRSAGVHVRASFRTRLAYSMSRTASCSRVTGASGAKVVSLVPTTTPV